MEHRFEYEFTETEEYNKELLRYLFIGRRKGVFVFIGVMFFVLIGLTVWLAVLGANLTSGIMGIAFCVLYFVLTFFLYFYSSSLVKKRVNEMFGGRFPTDTAYFTDSSMHVYVPGKPEMTVELSNVKTVKETEHILLLWTKARVLHAFSKSGFTKGTPEELKRFLKEKGATVKE